MARGADAVTSNRSLIDEPRGCGAVAIRLGGRVLIAPLGAVIAPGECLTLMGPSGCVRVGDVNLTSMPPERRGVGILFQDDQAAGSETADKTGWNAKRKSWLGYFSPMNARPPPLTRSEREGATVAETSGSHAVYVPKRHAVADPINTCACTELASIHAMAVVVRILMMGEAFMSISLW